MLNKFYVICAMLLSMFLFSGCEIIGGIFKVGFWAGIILFAVIIIIIVAVVKKIRKP